ncbi:hypothetical protein ACP70R_045821 [Stipagrostis hirtigluma subsp. patula]
MAGRFLFQKFAGMSRFRSLLGARVSAPARAGTPVTPAAPEGGIGTLRNLSHGAAARPGTAVHNCHGILAYEGGVRTLWNLSRETAVRPVMSVLNNRAVHGYAARYLNSSPCSRAPAETRWSKITSPMKPAVVDSARKRTFSSNASKEQEPKYGRKDKIEGFGNSMRDMVLASTTIGVCWFLIMIRES